MEMTTIGGIVPFLIYFAAGLAFLAIFFKAYLRLTPYDDLALIRQGNTSAAITLAGALLGYVFPLARSIEQAYGPVDFFVWGAVAMVIQILVFIFIKNIFRNFVEQVEQDRVGEAIVLAAISIAIGLLSAAAMTD